MRYLLALAVMLLPVVVLARPMGVYVEGVTIVTLTDEPCRLKTSVKNLPLRLTWTVNGADREGCYRLVRHPSGVVIVSGFYDDQSVRLLGLEDFVAVAQ